MVKEKCQSDYSNVSVQELRKEILKSNAYKNGNIVDMKMYSIVKQ